VKLDTSNDAWSNRHRPTSKWQRGAAMMVTASLTTTTKQNVGVAGDDRKTKDESNVEDNQSVKNMAHGDKLYCALCDVKCQNQHELANHLSGRRHRTALMHSNSTPKQQSHKLFRCESCNIICKNDKEFQQHLKGKKHAVNTDESEQHFSQKKGRGGGKRSGSAKDGPANGDLRNIINKRRHTSH
jgi:hypothetical protein